MWPFLRTINVSNMTRVVILRDPFERALSAYQNAATNKWISVPGCQGPQQCSFDVWVTRIYRYRQRAFRNNHTRPQAQIAQVDRMHYHYYLRMSSPVDQEFFWHELVGQGPHWSNPSTNTTHSIRDIMNGIQNETLHRLAQIYHEDLILWERLLQFGTPRQNGEYTMYDYYVDHMKTKTVTAAATTTASE